MFFCNLKEGVDMWSVKNPDGSRTRFETPNCRIQAAYYILYMNHNIDFRTSFWNKFKIIFHNEKDAQTIMDSFQKDDFFTPFRVTLTRDKKTITAHSEGVTSYNFVDPVDADKDYTKKLLGG